jgi:transposase
LVRHRSTLKNRIHAALIAFGHPCPVSDLFGHAGRDLLDRLQIPDPWRANIDVSLALIDDLELRIAELTVRLKRQGAEHRYIPVLVTAPGIGWINAYTIASEIGDIGRFASPAKLCGYPTHQAPPGPPTRPQGRPDRAGPQAHRSDLAHAHPQPALRSGRCRFSSSRLTAHFGHAPPDEPLRFSQVPASDGAIET